MNGKLMEFSGSRVANYFNDLLCPKSCLMCGAIGSFLCPLCRNKINLTYSCLCPVCKLDHCDLQHQIHLNKIYCLASYHQWGIGELITNIKYNFLVDLLHDFWRQELNKFYLTNRQVFDGKLIVPIPLHYKKRLRRGFNQSELIANIFQELSGNPVNARLLVRIIDNPTQAGSGAQERLANASGIFRVDYRELSKCYGKNILIIDDVYTTGATMAEAASELNRHGFKRIDGLVLAVS